MTQIPMVSQAEEEKSYWSFFQFLPTWTQQVFFFWECAQRHPVCQGTRLRG